MKRLLMVSWLWNEIKKDTTDTKAWPRKEKNRNSIRIKIYFHQNEIWRGSFYCSRTVVNECFSFLFRTDRCSCSFRSKNETRCSECACDGKTCKMSPMRRLMGRERHNRFKGFVFVAIEHHLSGNSLSD